MKTSMQSQPADAFDEDYLRQTIDTQHKRWRWVLITNGLTLIGVSVALTGTLVHYPQTGSFHALFAGSYVFAAMLFLLAILFGPGFLFASHGRALNDELTRARQARAARLGFLLVVLALCGELVAIAGMPHLAITALPGAIVVVVPGLYFLFLQRRAERDG